MAYICLKWRVYVKNGLSNSERAKICGKWRRSVGNCSNMWGNGLIIWQTALKCGKWLTDLGHSQNIWEMA